MAVTFPSIPISQSSSRTTATNMSVVQFGGGYEQRTPIGINYMRDKWAIVWEMLPSADKDTIVTFLVALTSGDYTSWTSPLDSSAKKFVLDGDWQIQNVGASYYTITCALRQVFDA